MALLYLGAAWLIMQVVDMLIDRGPLPESLGPITLAILAIGFPIALIISWFYEITPEGISLERDVIRAESITHITGRWLDFIVISLLSAAVLLFAWHTWWPSTPTDKSIAVLPFQNMSADPEQEYFSDGISEELLNVLSELPGLRVVARTSSFQYKGENRDVIDIGQQLNVAFVVEGSVRKAGPQVRITTQLIDASNGFHLWSETYDRELDDIFAVQDEIAGQIFGALKAKLALAGGEEVLPTAIGAANADAYDAYLRGRELIHRRGQQSLEEAIRYLEQSLRLDETYAPAHAQLAIATLLLGGRDRTPQKAIPKAISHLQRAQALEPDMAEVYGAWALLANSSGDPESAIEYARKALALNPNYADAQNWLFLSLARLSRYDEAFGTLKQVLVVDPLSSVGRGNYAFWLGSLGRIEESHEVADKLLTENARAGYLSHATTSLFAEGKIAEGLSWALKAQAEDHSDFRSAALVVQALIMVGEYDEARRVSDNLAFVVDVFEGRIEEAIQATQKNMQLNPASNRAIRQAANVLYDARRFDEALPLFERIRELEPIGSKISASVELDVSYWEPMIRLALVRRETGDEPGAQSAKLGAEQDLAAWNRLAETKNDAQCRAEAMIAAFDDDPDRVIAALQLAIQRGMRSRRFFDDPVFKDMQGKPRFVALRQEVGALLADERAKVLQLICFNNPTPDNWQPLPETCAGVKTQ